MNNIINKIFKKKNNIIIGALHFPPLLGYPDFPGFGICIKNAIEDLRAFENGGVDGVIFENNYDIPHKYFVEKTTTDSMLMLGKEIKKRTKLPLGVNVLWNDYYASLKIAKKLDLQFVRIPVFVDRVKTDCGIISGQYKKVIDIRKSIHAQNLALLTDIHVKHSVLLSQKDIVVSARRAIKNLSDAIIITGKWTGEKPDIKELKTIRKHIPDFPIFIGSGTDKDNIAELSRYANGFIVSTSLKKGKKKKKEINVKTYAQRIDVNKVKKLVSAIDHNK